MFKNSKQIQIVISVAIILGFLGLMAANKWIKQEIEHATEVQQPVVQAGSTAVKSPPAVRTSSVKKAAELNEDEPEIKQNGDNDKASSRKKRKKIIYEIPLDDVILPQ